MSLMIKREDYEEIAASLFDRIKKPLMDALEQFVFLSSPPPHLIHLTPLTPPPELTSKKKTSMLSNKLVDL